MLNSATEPPDCAARRGGARCPPVRSGARPSTDRLGGPRSAAARHHRRLREHGAVVPAGARAHSRPAGARCAAVAAAWTGVGSGSATGCTHRRSSSGRSRRTGPADRSGAAAGQRVRAPDLGPAAWLVATQQGLGDHVLLATTRSGVHVQRQGLYVQRSHYAEAAPVDGLPLMTAAQTLVELARDLTLFDLVPMVDCALAAGASPDEILAAARPGARGAGSSGEPSGWRTRVASPGGSRCSGWCTSWRAWGRWSARLTLPAGTESSPGPTSTWSARVGTRSATAGSMAPARATPGRSPAGQGDAQTRCRALRLHHERDRSAAARGHQGCGDGSGVPTPTRGGRPLVGCRTRVHLTAYGRTRLAGRLRRYRLAAER